MTTDDVAEYLRRTGRLPELSVVKALTADDWKAQHSASYEDKDEGKNREIDVLATKYSSGNEAGVFLIFHLVIEVKHSTSPWVAFVSKRPYRRSAFSVLHATNTRNFSGESRLEDSRPFLSGECFPEEPVREAIEEHAKSLISLPSKEGDGKLAKSGRNDDGNTSRALEAIRQATKAATFFRNQLQDRYDTPVGSTRPHWTVEVFHPIVVTTAELFTVALDEDGKEIVSSCEWIPFELNYSSPHYRKGVFGDSYYPDVVSLKHLDQYLIRVNAWRDAMAAQMKLEMSFFQERDQIFKALL